MRRIPKKVHKRHHNNSIAITKYKDRLKSRLRDPRNPCASNPEPSLKSAVLNQMRDRKTQLKRSRKDNQHPLKEKQKKLVTLLSRSQETQLTIILYRNLLTAVWAGEWRGAKRITRYTRFDKDPIFLPHKMKSELSIIIGVKIVSPVSGSTSAVIIAAWSIDA